MKGPTKKRRRTLVKSDAPPDRKMVHFEAASIIDIGRNLELIFAVIVTVSEALNGQAAERDEEFASVLGTHALDPLYDQIRRLSLEETP
jgi:hypothetical protein